MPYADPEKNAECKRAYARANPEREKARVRDWCRRNPEKLRARRAAKREYMRDYQLRRLYGITSAQFDVMLEAQAGLCQMCTEPMVPGKGTHVDHDHATGEVRGLLCTSCNARLGWYERAANDAVSYLTLRRVA